MLIEITISCNLSKGKDRTEACKMKMFKMLYFDMLYDLYDL